MYKCLHVPIKSQMIWPSSIIKWLSTLEAGIISRKSLEVLQWRLKRIPPFSVIKSHLVLKLCSKSHIKQRLFWKYLLPQNWIFFINSDLNLFLASTRYLQSCHSFLRYWFVIAQVKIFWNLPWHRKLNKCWTNVECVETKLIVKLKLPP